MHTYTLCKLRAPSADEARDLLKDLMEENTGEGHYFDYTGDITQVVKKVTDKKEEQELAPFKSYKELVEHQKGLTITRKEYFLKEIKQKLFEGLAEHLMSPKEAPLYVADEKAKIASKVLVAKPKEPLSFDETLDKIMDVLVNNDMLSWYIEKVSNINTWIDYPNEFSSYIDKDFIHYLDLTKEFSEGKDFYFYVDRHS